MWVANSKAHCKLTVSAHLVLLPKQEKKNRNRTYTCLLHKSRGFAVIQHMLMGIVYMVCAMAWVCVCYMYYPSEEFSSQLTHSELTWNSQKAHLVWVTVSSFWGHLSNSQCTHKMSPQWAFWELSVSLQLSQLAHCYHCMVRQFIVWAHLVRSLWAS